MIGRHSLHVSRWSRWRGERLRRLVVRSAIGMTLPLGAASAQAAVQREALDYHETLRQATRRLDAQEWAAAAPLWERVVRVNPHVPDFWLALGRAHFNAQRYRESVAPFERALELGAGTPSVLAYNVARAYANLREPDSAIAWLARALRLGHRNREALQRDEAFTALRGDARFRTIAAVADSTVPAGAERWRHDIDFLEEEVVRLRATAPDRPSRLPEFRARMAALRARLPLPENQIAVEIMRALATLGDGHTGSWPEAVRAWGQRAAPLQFYDFADGLHVIAADPAYRSLVGARVTRVGSHEVGRVRLAIDSLVGKDHHLGGRGAFTRFLRYPQVLHGLGLTARDDVLPLTVRHGDGREQVVSVGVQPSHADYHRFFGRPTWADMLSREPETLPLYLRNRETFYWYTHLPEARAIYFQFNRTRNAPAEPLDRFVTRLFAAVDSTRAERLVVDLRLNYGGNTALVLPLIHEVIKRERLSRRGGLFVIVGRATFSAAQNVATLLDRNASPIFVGEPSGSSPNFVGEDNAITLPYSRMDVSISDLYWQSSWPQDKRIWIAPTLFAPPTFAAYRDRVDPALDAIRAYLAAQGADASPVP